MQLLSIIIQSPLIHAILLLQLATPVSSLTVKSPPSNNTTMSSGSNNAMDRLALLAFKAQISDDPSGALDLWGDESNHLSQWQGVACDELGRVTALDLDSLSLAGSVSPFLSKLTSLQILHLASNRLHGPIPPELGSLSQLQHLNLSSNSLVGEIPANLSHCRHLRTIDLSDNKLRGEIPSKLSSDLQTMSLAHNMITGDIPGSIGSLSSLIVLGLGNNYLTGNIPDSIGKLSSIVNLDLSSNNLSGVIPPSLWNLSSLTYLYLQSNQLSGALPRRIGHLLPRLRHLYMQHNEFSGTIPSSLGSLPGLARLLLSNNRFKAREAEDWAFLTALTNCSNLRILELSHNMLQGEFPGATTNLSTKFEWLAMSGNEISGGIPAEIGNLISLTTLYMSFNLLTGTIPATIGGLPRLQQLSFGSNMISGAIPPSIGNLSQLTVLSLASNSLTGGIPPSLRNLSSLSVLDLSENDLGGSIPPWVGILTRLAEIYLYSNHLTGVTPPSLWNLSSLTYINVAYNNLTGALPFDIGRTLPRLQSFQLGHNLFHGPIPVSLPNASAIAGIELSENAFEGTIPRDLGNLQGLWELLLGGNKLEARGASDWSFLDSLTNCTKLRRLSLSRNRLGGVLPKSNSNLSAELELLLIRGNQISGSIPVDIEKLINIQLLDLGGNLLTGGIPSTIGRLSSLRALHLDRNTFSGEIPMTIGNLTRLNQLYLNINELSGRIPVSLSNCPLQLLNLNQNKLTGSIPRELLLVSSLTRYLGLAYNSLAGPLPSEVGSLRNLRILSISENRLSGVIPSSMGQCQILEYLSMDGNLFSGTIPLSLQDLRGLQNLDLSRNNLSGRFPEFLKTFPFLVVLNLSFNNLEGEVPNDGIFRNLSTFSVLGNSQLCGGQPNLCLQPCSNQSSGTKYWPIILLAVTGILCCVLLYLAAAIVRNQKLLRDSVPIIDLTDESTIEIPFSCKDHMDVSYELLLEATDGFSADNLIGAGSFGSVYKGTMDCDDGNKLIAIKVLNLQQRGASTSFVAECEALRNIRHRNLVKVFTACSGLDSRGNEFKALVFEYMPNGSVEMWLHPDVNDQRGHRRLDLIQRLNIAIDVASALDYLHHHGPMPIAHCDLKPSNILLDNDMNAHVGDFGLARFLAETTSGSAQNPTGSIGLKGSIGYVAPEYGMANKASTEGDVYSYGVLLLEMFTGKRPTDDAFVDGISLCRFVEMAFHEGIIGIADPRLLSEDEDGEADDNTQSIGADRGRAEECCLASVFRIGISCAKVLPRERMQMGDVAKELMEIKMTIFGSGSKNQILESN